MLKIMSPGATGSPAFLNHFLMLPSPLVPIFGIRSSTSRASPPQAASSARISATCSPQATESPSAAEHSFKTPEAAALTVLTSFPSATVKSPSPLATRSPGCLSHFLMTPAFMSAFSCGI